LGVDKRRSYSFKTRRRTAESVDFRQNLAKSKISVFDVKSGRKTGRKQRKMDEECSDSKGEVPIAVKRSKELQNRAIFIEIVWSRNYMLIESKTRPQTMGNDVKTFGVELGESNSFKTRGKTARTSDFW